MSNHEVSVLGLGAMGSAIARVLAEGGRPVIAWNRSPRSAPGRIPVAHDVGAAVAASPLVLVCVLDHAAARATLDAAGDALAGRSVVNLTSSSPAQGRELATAVEARGAAYLDGSIMADPEHVGTAQSSFLYSGAPAAWDAHREVLDALGTARYLGADPGAAAVHFMALVAVGYETWIAYLDTLAYGRVEGVAARELGPSITGMFAAMTGLLEAMAVAVDDGRHPPAAGSLRVHAALMADVIATRRAAGGDATQLERVRGLIERRLAAGGGEDGFSSLIGGSPAPA